VVVGLRSAQRRRTYSASLSWISSVFLICNPQGWLEDGWRMGGPSPPLGAQRPPLNPSGLPCVKVGFCFMSISDSICFDFGRSRFRLLPTEESKVKTCQHRKSL